MRKTVELTVIIKYNTKVCVRQG